VFCMLKGRAVMSGIKPGCRVQVIPAMSRYYEECMPVVSIGWPLVLLDDISIGMFPVRSSLLDKLFSRLDGMVTIGLRLVLASLNIMLECIYGICERLSRNFSCDLNNSGCFGMDGYILLGELRIIGVLEK
jgi:hypothetical protein